MNILIDAGACQGAFTESWLKRNPKGRVYCIEPDVLNASKLRDKFVDQNVEVIEKAIWMSEETQTLWKGSSVENASITICSEAQIEHPDGGSVDVDCVTLPGLIKQVVNFEEDILTLKVDIEGVEFRCLDQMFKSNTTPNFIYLEDGCRKVLDTKEWLARISVFKHIINYNLSKNIFIEGNTKKHSDYMKGYLPIDAHKQYQAVRDRKTSLDELVNSLKKVVESFLAQNPDDAKNIADIKFYFTWLTCHLFSVTMHSKEILNMSTPEPMNSTKDADLVDRFVSSINFKINSQKECQWSAQFTSLKTRQLELDNMMKARGKKDLL